MQISAVSERHANGGPGECILSRVEDALPALLETHRGRVQLIYLDPPFGTGDTFHMKLHSGNHPVTSSHAHFKILSDISLNHYTRFKNEK